MARCAIRDGHRINTRPHRAKSIRSQEPQVAICPSRFVRALTNSCRLSESGQTREFCQ